MPPDFLLLVNVRSSHLLLVIVREQYPELGVLLKNLVTEALFQNLGLKSGHDAFSRKDLRSLDRVEIQDLLSIKEELEFLFPLLRVNHEFSLSAQSLVIEGLLCPQKLPENDLKLILESQLGDLSDAHRLLVGRFCALRERRDCGSLRGAVVLFVLIHAVGHHTHSAPTCVEILPEGRSGVAHERVKRLLANRCLLWWVGGGNEWVLCLVLCIHVVPRCLGLQDIP